MFDTLLVFLKELLKKGDFEKKQQTTKEHDKVPSLQIVRMFYFSEITWNKMERRSSRSGPINCTIYFKEGGLADWDK